MSDERIPILIVGAGPTGLMLGIELARRDVPFRLVDRLREPLSWNRATVVHSRSLEIFEAIGTEAEFLGCGHVISTVGFYDHGERVGALQLGGVDSRYPFDINIPEDRTERILIARLEQLGGEVERGIEFVELEQADDGVRVVLRSLDGPEEELVVGFVVGCDGYYSAIRASIDVGFDGVDYPTRWAVVDTRLSGWRHPGDETPVQLESPGMNPLPLPDGRFRIYFRAPERDEDTMDWLNEGLDALSPGARPEQPSAPQFFHTHFRVAERYRSGRVLLAGDAAHVCSPIQGHGMNAGVQDAYNLGWKLALAVGGAAPDALLDSYEVERRPVAEAIGRSGDSAERRWAEQDDAMTRKIMEKLATQEGEHVASIGASEIGFSYEESPIVGEVMLPPRPSPVKPGVCLDVVCLGARVGDAEPLEGPAVQRRLHELIQTSQFTLLVLLDEPDAAVAERELEQARQLVERYGPHLETYVVTRNDLELSGAPSELVWDSSGAVHARFQAGEPAICLVRPDGHLGFRSSPPSWEALESHLGELLVPA